MKAQQEPFPSWALNENLCELPSTWQSSISDRNSSQEHCTKCPLQCCSTWSALPLQSITARWLTPTARTAQECSPFLSAAVQSTSFPTKQVWFNGINTTQLVRLNGCCAGWQRGYCLACNLISSQGLADFFPLSEASCPVWHTQYCPLKCFADRISSTTEHFQCMTSEHIKLALSSTEKSLGFSFWCQSKKDLMTSWTLMFQGKKESVQLTPMCWDLEL